MWGGKGRPGGEAGLNFLGACVWPVLCPSLLPGYGTRPQGLQVMHAGRMTNALPRDYSGWHYCQRQGAGPRRQQRDHLPALPSLSQIAPAVRVAISECFGLPPGATSANQLAEALRRLGFDLVFGTQGGGPGERVGGRLASRQ